jgi:hypothetical protein
VNETRTKTGTGLLASWRPEPLDCLPGYGRDAFEVPIAVQQSQSLQFCRGGDNEIHRPGAAVLAALSERFLDLPGAVIGPVVDGNPAEYQPHVLYALRTVSSRASAVELELGDRTYGNQPARCCLIQTVPFRVTVHESREGAGIDEELRRGHRR